MLKKDSKKIRKKCQLEPKKTTCLSKEREERTQVRAVEACNLKSENLKLVSAKLRKGKKKQTQKTGEISNNQTKTAKQTAKSDQTHEKQQKTAKTAPRGP